MALLFGVRMALYLNSLMVLVPRWSAQTAAELTARYGCVFTVAPTPFLMDSVTHAEQHGSEQGDRMTPPDRTELLAKPALSEAERARNDTLFPKKKSLPPAPPRISCGVSSEVFR